MLKHCSLIITTNCIRDNRSASYICVSKVLSLIPIGLSAILESRSLVGGLGQNVFQEEGRKWECLWYLTFNSPPYT